MTGFTIQRAEAAADLADTARLFLAYANSLPIDLGYQDFEAELAGLPGAYAPPERELLLARSDAGEAIGCVALRSFPAPGCCEMKRLFVSPAARGLKLGRALVDRILEAAIAAGYSEMRLDTLPSLEAALAIYE